MAHESLLEEALDLIDLIRDHRRDPVLYCIDQIMSGRRTPEDEEFLAGLIRVEVNEVRRNRVESAA